MNGSHSKLSLGSLFTWLVYCAAYMSILGSTVEIFGTEPLSNSRCGLIAGCWLVLLCYYLARRHRGALIVHVIVVVPLPVVLALPGVDEQEFTRLVAAPMWFASFLSFPISVVKLAEQAFRHDAPATIYLAYNVVGCTTLFCFLCTIVPSLGRRTLHWPSATFGALIGVWVGLYLAVKNSDELRRARIVGVSARTAAAAGLWIGLVGSLIFWLLNRFVLPFPWLPVAFAPLVMGTLGALAVGLARRQSSPIRSP